MRTSSSGCPHWVIGRCDTGRHENGIGDGREVAEYQPDVYGIEGEVAGKRWFGRQAPQYVRPAATRVMAIHHGKRRI